jgi:hypothetical protein
MSVLANTGMASVAVSSTSEYLFCIIEPSACKTEVDVKFCQKKNSKKEFWWMLYVKPKVRSNIPPRGSKRASPAGVSFPFRLCQRSQGPTRLKTRSIEPAVRRGRSDGPHMERV